MTSRMMLPKGGKPGSVTRSWVQNHAGFQHDSVPTRQQQPKSSFLVIFLVLSIWRERGTITRTTETSQALRLRLPRHETSRLPHPCHLRNPRSCPRRSRLPSLILDWRGLTGVSARRGTAGWWCRRGARPPRRNSAPAGRRGSRGVRDGRCRRTSAGPGSDLRLQAGV
jgi:hypothetical protein